MTPSNPNEEEVVLRRRSTEGSALSAGLRWPRKTVTKKQGLPVRVGGLREAGGHRRVLQL